MKIPEELALGFPHIMQQLAQAKEARDEEEIQMMSLVLSEDEWFLNFVIHILLDKYLKT